MAGTASAQITANDTENTSVDVTVSSTIAVDVQPANLDYTSATVGNRETTSDRGFGAIEVDNTGSEYINRIWLNTSIHESDPYATGSSSQYDAGNFIEVKSSESLLSADSGAWHPVNKQIFLTSEGDDSGNGNAETDIPSFIQVPSGWGNYEVGRYRRGNESIYFAIDAADSGNGVCDGSGSAELRVGNVSATDSRLGTVDFTSSTEYGWENYSISTVSGSSYGISTRDGGEGSGAGVVLNWTYAGDGQTNVDLLTKCDDSSEQPNVIATRYNPTATGADDLTSGNGAAVGYLLEETSGTTSNMLAPGETVTIQTAVDVPLGVSEGAVSQGTLRVLITADKDAN